jgi:hypothetical protein
MSRNYLHNFIKTSFQTHHIFHDYSNACCFTLFNVFVPNQQKLYALFSFRNSNYYLFGNYGLLQRTNQDWSCSDQNCFKIHATKKNNICCYLYQADFDINCNIILDVWAFSNGVIENITNPKK